MYMLFALALVFGLSVAAVPQASEPAAAQNGAELEVDVHTYLKSVEGEFTELVGEIAPCEDFYVNATVANVGDYTAYDVTATIFIVGNADIVAGETYNKDMGDIDAHWVHDVWWLLHCDGPGEVTITVTADASNVSPVSDTATVDQGDPPTPDTVLEITWIEPPPSGLIDVSTIFGVKALIENKSGSVTAEGVLATISLVGVPDAATGITGSAEIVGGDPDTWPVGDIKPGRSEEVGWTLHCLSPGDVEITVDADFVGEQPGQVLPASDTVDQKIPATLRVVITSPEASTQVLAASCDTLDWDDFELSITVYNDGDVTAHDVWLEWYTSGPGSCSPSSDYTYWATIGPGGSVTPTPWALTCTSEGDVTFNAYAYDDVVSTAWATPVTIHQKDFTVEITDPTSSTTFSTGQSFTVSVRMRNGTGQNLSGVRATLTSTAGVSIADPLKVFNICDCCEIVQTWTVTCTDNTDGELTVTVYKSDGVTLLGSDTVTIHQEEKAHLLVGGWTYLQDQWGKMQPTGSFVVSQDWHLVVPVHNMGEADATDVAITLTASAGVSVVSSPPGGTEWQATISSIPGGESGKAIWTLHCDGEGEVTIEALAGVVGKDDNTKDWIPDANKDIFCDLTIEQVYFEVDILNPEWDANVTVCENFVVKAKVINPGGSTNDLTDVSATIKWDGPAELVEVAPGQPQSETKDLGDLPAPSDGDTEKEVTWQMHCTGEGDVSIWVKAQATTPLGGTVRIESDEDTGTAGYQPVVVHQDYEDTSLEVDILSPDHGGFYATSQEFAVTATITNTGTVENDNPVTLTDVDALDVVVALSVYPEDSVSIEAPEWRLGTMGPGDIETLTWTVHCNEQGPAVITVEADAANAGAACDLVMVNQYPAAHLEVTEITVLPAGPIEVCTEFTLTATVVNTGEADASEVSATLSVFPEGSAHITEGGYTKYIGTLAGHGQDGNTTVTWNLHCKEACDTTFTINLAGYDEYGWHQKQESQTTGTFLIWDGYEFFEILDTPPTVWSWIADWTVDGPMVHQYEYAGWTYGYFVGDASGLLGPFNFDAGLQFAEMGGDQRDYLGHITGMGYVIPNSILADGDDLLVWIAHVVLDPMFISDLDEMTTEWDVCGGLLQVINGNLNGAYLKGYHLRDLDGYCYPEWEVGLLNGTYHSTMASTPGLAIPERFIEPKSITVKQLEAVEIVEEVTAVDLVEGWNLMSLALIPDPANPEDIELVLADILANVDKVWSYDATLLPGDPWLWWNGPAGPGIFDTMTDGMGYWVIMTADGEPFTLTFEGVVIPAPPGVPPVYSVYEGWNLIGFKSTTPRLAGDYLAALGETVTIIYGFADGFYFIVESTDLMEPGLGYWIAVTEPGTIYP